MPKVTLLAGLGYGDEGKGSVVDFLCREQGAKLVVRYNGGAQAAHNVVTDDGRHHTFAQFGSGTFAGAQTHLSRYMLVNPVAFLAEGKALTGKGVPDAFDRVTVHREALVTNPFQVAANRLREIARGGGRHGSCGMGIGETMADSLTDGPGALIVGDLQDRATMKVKLAASQARKIAELEPVVTALRGHESTIEREWAMLRDGGLIDWTIDRYYEPFTRLIRIVDDSFLATALGVVDAVFEGAQGVLLDQDFGFQPYTTWTDCTFGNAYKLLKGRQLAFPQEEIERLGVLRGYMTRHGAGPFVSEHDGFQRLSEHDHNGLGHWQGAFRSGAFDSVAARYALDVIGGVDGIAMTNLDRLPLYSNCDGVPVCIGYDTMAALPVKRPIDLAHQEQLATTLMNTKPVYDAVHVEERRTADLYAQCITENLKVPLAIVSHGPRASDKRRCNK